MTIYTKTIALAVHERRMLDKEILAGTVRFAPRLGADPTVCPRQGCGGRVFIENGAHVCLSCGWRQEHQTEKFKHLVEARKLWNSMRDEDEEY